MFINSYTVIFFSFLFLHTALLNSFKIYFAKKKKKSPYSVSMFQSATPV